MNEETRRYEDDVKKTQNPIENFPRVSLKVELKRVRFDDGHMVQSGVLQQARWLGGPSAKRGGCHEAHLGKPGLSMYTVHCTVRCGHGGGEDGITLLIF